MIVPISCLLFVYDVVSFHARLYSLKISKALVIHRKLLTVKLHTIEDFLKLTEDFPCRLLLKVIMLTLV